MGKGSSAPAPPDPYETARSESQFNRLDTYGPSGSGIRHGYTDPNTGAFAPGLAPQGAQSAQKTVESKIERQLRKILEPASKSLTQRIVTDNITNMPDAARVQDRGEVGQQIFDRSFSMMAPAIERTNSRLISNLQARGLPVGGDAFNEAYGDQQRQTQDTISRLAMDADIASGQEQSRAFSLDQAARGSAISELVAAMGGGYNPPSNVPSGAATPVNYSGMVSQNYNAQVAQANQNSANKMAGATALGGLGSMLLFCSASYKAIESGMCSNWAAQIVQHIPLYVWRYNAEIDADRRQHVGPMAENFNAMTGLGDPNTINVIDYLGVLTGALQNALQRIELLEHEVAGGRKN